MPCLPLHPLSLVTNPNTGIPYQTVFNNSFCMLSPSWNTSVTSVCQEKLINPFSTWLCSCILNTRYLLVHSMSTKWEVSLRSIPSTIPSPTTECCSYPVLQGFSIFKHSPHHLHLLSHVQFWQCENQLSDVSVYATHVSCLAAWTHGHVLWTQYLVTDSWPMAQTSYSCSYWERLPCCFQIAPGLYSRKRINYHLILML